MRKWQVFRTNPSDWSGPSTVESTDADGKVWRFRFDRAADAEAVRNLLENTDAELEKLSRDVAILMEHATQSDRQLLSLERLVAIRFGRN